MWIICNVLQYWHDLQADPQILVTLTFGRGCRDNGTMGQWYNEERTRGTMAQWRDGAMREVVIAEGTMGQW